MIRISTLALGAALVVGLAGEAAAQQGGTQGSGQEPGAAARDGRRGGEPGQALLKGIDLTDAQKAQLETIHERHRAERQSMRDSLGRGRPDSSERAALMRAQARRWQELRSVLTPAQQATFDANLARLRELPRGEGRRGRPGRGGGR